MKNRRDTIEQLQADARIYGYCPNSDCGEPFPLRHALLFYADEPLPERAREVLAEWKDELGERKRGLGDARRLARQQSEQRAIDVNLGKILEKIAPVFDGFGYSARDCRALFEPIDYVVFQGLARRRQVEALVFVDIKTGGGGLNRHQRQVRDAVNDGRVQWMTYANRPRS